MLREFVDAFADVVSVSALAGMAGDASAGMRGWSRGAPSTEATVEQSTVR